MAPPLDRREFLRAAAAAATLPALPALAAAPAAGFPYGVASGDPQANAVMLWTQATPTEGSLPLAVNWTVARDEAMRRIVASGQSWALAQTGHTVKIDVQNLEPATTYYYRFSVGGAHSVTGRTRTLPAGKLDHLKLALTTCGAYDAGYFNTYRAIAASDVAAVIHVGDYIYEGAGADDNPLGRAHQPRHAAVTLDDYRERYRQYRSDPDLQELHRRHPMIAVWDDHEIANDAWSGGAQAHKPGDGDWAARKAAAVQAYHEWLPLRLDASGNRERIWRSFSFGDLAELCMLETRLSARSAPAPGLGAADPARTLIGHEQREWLFSRLQAPARWKLIGQQVQMAPLNYLPVDAPVGSALPGGLTVGAGGLPYSVDKWDGFAAERQRLYDFVRERSIQNLVVLTGDNHYALAADLIPEPLNPQDRPLAVEFGVTAASSRLVGEMLQQDLPRRPDSWIRHYENRKNGWIELDLTHTRTVARYYSVATRARRVNQVSLSAQWSVKDGANRLSAV